MIGRALFCTAAAGAMVVLNACGGSTSATTTGGGASTPTPAPATVAVGTVAPLGQILVDGKGRTLYLFEADTTTASTCSGACAQTWQPFTTVGPPQAGSGASQSLLATAPRSAGPTQVTYNGHPLYYFASDAKSGDATGEGNQSFGAGWDVLSPAGAKIEKPGG